MPISIYEFWLKMTVIITFAIISQKLKISCTKLKGRGRLSRKMS